MGSARPGILRAFAWACVAVPAGIALYFGFEWLGSDMATRIRYGMLRQHALMHLLGRDSVQFSLRPDHGPDACPGPNGYRVAFSPYKGNKAVAVGDIEVTCRDGGGHATGFGSEDIRIARELAVDKSPDEPLTITLRRDGSNSEIASVN